MQRMEHYLGRKAAACWKGAVVIAERPRNGESVQTRFILRRPDQPDLDLACAPPCTVDGLFHAAREALYQLIEAEKQKAGADGKAS
jgi:hypothetical protein